MVNGMRNVALLVWAACAMNSEALAQNKPGIAEETTSESTVQGPTVVFGAAATAAGGEDAVVVEQPAGAANPLGNPIPEQVVAQPAVTESNADAEAAPVNETENSEENKAVSPAAAEKLGKDFQNTLMEANGMVYDVQAYPEADLPVIGDPANPETIYSPNVNQ